MTIKLTRLDLDYILTQIQMAEAGQLPVNPLLSFGLREVAGTNNNLAPGQSTFGSSDVLFPTLTDPMFQNAQAGTNYAQTSGLVMDAAPRTISVLVASQNAKAGAGADGILGTADDTFVSGNAAAFAAQQTGPELPWRRLPELHPARRGRHLWHRGRYRHDLCRRRRHSRHPRRHHDVRQPGHPDEGLRPAARPASARRRACSSPT